VAFSPSYEVFVITRLLSGAFNIATFIAAFTYGTCIYLYSKKKKIIIIFCRFVKICMENFLHS